jgi:hypothetical protein
MCLLISFFLFLQWMDINVMLVYLSSTILGAGNDGTIWRWDQVSPSSSKTEAIQAAVAADANA